MMQSQMMQSQSMSAPAGFWIRFVAAILDSMILGGVNFALMMIDPALSLVGLVIALVYYVYFPSSDMMGTPGKSVLGLKITDEHGNKISMGTAVMREILGKFISAIIMYIGFLMVGFTDRKRGLHDMIANTVVVYK